MSIKCPASLLVAGPSGAGKTSLIAKIVQNCGAVFDNPISNIIIAHGRSQNIYDDIIRVSPVPVRLIQGLPNNLIPPKNTFLIIDDLQGSEFSRTIAEFFTMNSHHYKTTVAYLVQNLFLQTPHHRTASLNAHYIILFKNPRSGGQILSLAKQIAPSNSSFVVDAFKQSTEHAHGYLMIDLKQKTDENLRLRNSIFPDSHFFIDKKKGDPFNLPI